MSEHPRRKQYVKVVATHDVDGSVEPHTIILAKGELFPIEEMKGVTPMTAIPPFDMVNRYAVVVKGQETSLYEENGRFFVKMKS